YYSWQVLSNSAGASIAGSAFDSSVQVRSGGSGGSYLLTCSISGGPGSLIFESCSSSVQVYSLISSSAVTNQTVCALSDVVFSTEPSGSGPLSFVWRKDGALIPGATTSALTLPDVTVDSKGTYCVEVAGFCNAVTNCAVLTVLPPPSITCPATLSVQC